VSGVLVTGATGFIGKALLPFLVHRGHTVIPVVRRQAGLPNELVVPDIDGATQWRHAFTGCDAVVHLAARVHAMNDNINNPLLAYRKTNVEGTLALATTAAEAGVRRFVFISSIKVNGERTNANTAFRADDLPDPVDPYGISKLEAEEGLLALSRKTGMEIVIIRPTLVYGPGVKGNFASLTSWLRKGVPLPLGAIYTNRRSVLALGNLIAFIALCVNRSDSPKAANQVFLLSDDEAVSTTELLHRVAHAYKVKCRLLPVPEQWLHVAFNLLGMSSACERLLGSLVVDSSKARDLLGWHSAISMDQELQKMANYDAHI
jgi:nucleoside-diphosphate-sugar epimerase